ncbi:MAG: rhamnogalacturonan acetylesterase [Bacteroidales bacterium]|nr:rhamnogalacturonan acetylesterase [Bacteroidales bacterium]
MKARFLFPISCLLFVLALVWALAHRQAAKSFHWLVEEECLAPVRYSVPVPDGVYLVKATLGGQTAGLTTLRAESRRLFFEQVPTAAGESQTLSFCVHKRDSRLSDSLSVRLKPREKNKLNWNGSLDLEICGPAPRLKKLEIVSRPDVPVVFLCGNSTVVDQDNEPWASWGQVIPACFTDQVCIANFAESGEAANTFISARRLQKIEQMIKPGDYVFVEFGHNDQKQKGPGRGAYTSFWNSMRQFVEMARAHGATPVLLTPTQRRSFGPDGRIEDTHLDFPQATRDLAREMQVPLIDLHAMTRTLYEALGVEASKRAFVHYPAGSWPGQTADLADNTHFNPYGATQVAKCVVQGIRQAGLPLAAYLRADLPAYDPARPDDPDSFVWSPSEFIEIEKPDGN